MIPHTITVQRRFPLWPAPTELTDSSLVASQLSALSRVSHTLEEPLLLLGGIHQAVAHAGHSHTQI